MSRAWIRAPRAPHAWATLGVTLLAALAIALPPSGAAATTVIWLAQVGPGGANGKAAITAPDTAGAAGSLKLSLVGLSASATYAVKVQKGSCASPGLVLFTAPSQKSSAAGKISKVVTIPAAKMTSIRSATSLIVRVGSGSKLRCGPFTGGPPAPTPTPTPEPSLAATVGATAAVGGANTILGDIAADEAYVWTIDALWTYAYRLDPLTGRETRRMDFSSELELATGAAIGEGALWIGMNRLTVKMGEIVRVDMAKATSTARIQTPGLIASVTTGGGSVWAAQVGPDQILRIDPVKAEVLRAYPVKTKPAAVGYGGGYVWAVAESALLRIDPASSDVTTIELGGKGRGIAYVDGDIWVTAQSPGGSTGWNVVRVAPASGLVVERIPIAIEPWDVAGASGYVWVAPNKDDSAAAIAISTASDRVVSSVTLPHAMPFVAIRGRSAWFAGAPSCGCGASHVVRVDW